MKRHRIVLVLLIVAAVAWSQEELPEWRLVTYGNVEDDLVEQMNEVIDSGYVPAGVDIAPEQGITILYVRDEALPVYEWLLKDFADIEMLNDEFTGTITAGWLPMDITVTDCIVVGLFIRTDATVSGWRIAISGLTSGDAHAGQERLRDAGFTPWGIAYSEQRQLWHLGLGFPGEDVLQSSIIGIPLDSTAEETASVIATITDEGWRPWGITRTPTELAVQFVLMQ